MTGELSAGARPAATVVLVRDGSDGVQTCVLRRHDRSSFVAGAHVFAGGALDPDDLVGARCVHGLDDGAASALTGVDSGGLAFWMAAVRESFEETGVVPAVPATAAQLDALGQWRPEVHAGRRSMAAALESAGLAIDGRALRCFARWVTPVGAPRRYDTRFFVARMPEGQVVAEDGSELVEHEWVRPADALGRHRAGELVLIMPTVRTLVALSRFPTADAAVAGLSFGAPSTPLLVEVVERDGARLLLLASDPEGNGGLYDGDTAMPVDPGGAGVSRP